MADFELYLNNKDHASMTDEQRDLALRAKGHIAELLGPAPVGGHAVRKGETGPCRVCGVVAKLTFEHIPPRSSGNAQRRRGIDLAANLRSPLGRMPTSGWVAMQRGAGVYATCKNCNSFGGHEYVPAYSDAIAAAILGMKQFAEASAAAGGASLPGSIRLQMLRVRPGAVIRQVLFMLMVTSGSAGLVTRYPVLREIVLNKNRTSLPPEFSVRLSIVVTRRIRSSHLVSHIDWSTMTERAVVEVAHAPFAWLAEIGAPYSHTAPDVGAWTCFDPADEIPINLTLPVGSVVTALPGDYRHYWQIPQDGLLEENDG